jgi:diguanylate cyclase (GGDEF)-like protein
MTRPDSARVLIVDDNRSIHDDFRKILSSSARDTALQSLERRLYGAVSLPPAATAPFSVDHAYQGMQALELVQRGLREQHPFALAFVDMRMPPGWNGLETVQHLWAADPQLQVVICSAYTDHSWNEIVERLGQSDRLLLLKKPFEPIEALQCAHALTCKWRNERTLRGQLDSLEKVVTASTQGLEAANRQLRHMATHDALTALPNRLLLDDRLGQAIAHAERAGERFALAVLDLDRFKLINDSLGHRAGDEFLRGVARRISAALRGIDTVARLGGDEFVLILDQIGGPDEAMRVAHKVMRALQDPVHIGDVDIHPSASIGLACYPTDGTTSEALFAHADAAMYAAKRRGRKSIQRFAPDMDTSTQDRVKLEADLHQALELGQFELHYQPKVDARSGRYRGAEALIRWRHPDRGLVPPGEFVPLAEDTGLIIPIGAWVIREACRQVRVWQRDGLPAARVAVNVSATQFQQRELVDTVRRALDDSGIRASCLEIELTESAVMTNPEESGETLKVLSRMGVAVSVDDFGTGYSNMSYLRRFPLDKLKIDRSFIADLLTSPDAAALVRGIISLAHSLRLKVIAEGVETLEQMELLKGLGCDQLQGFCFSRPLPAAEYEQLMRAAQPVGRIDPEVECDQTLSRLAVLPALEI